jgi:hypothetical protein
MECVCYNSCILSFILTILLINGIFPQRRSVVLFQLVICLIHAPLPCNDTKMHCLCCLLAVRKGYVTQWLYGLTSTLKMAFYGMVLLTGFLLWPYIYGHFLGSFFYGGISPSKIGLIAPYLEQTQLHSKARVFLSS